MAEQFNRALTQASTRIVDNIASFLPGALVFVGMLIVAFVVALAIRSALRRGLKRLEFDQRLDRDVALLGLADRDPLQQLSQPMAPQPLGDLHRPAAR